jgi:hypothetical protein
VRGADAPFFFFFLQVTHRGLGALDGSRYGGVYKEL